MARLLGRIPHAQRVQDLLERLLVHLARTARPRRDELQQPRHVVGECIDNLVRHEDLIDGVVVDERWRLRYDFGQKSGLDGKGLDRDPPATGGSDSVAPVVWHNGQGAPRVVEGIVGGELDLGRLERRSKRVGPGVRVKGVGHRLAWSPSAEARAARATLDEGNLHTLHTGCFHCKSPWSVDSRARVAARSGRSYSFPIH